LEPWLLSEYLVGKNSVDLERTNWNESAMSNRKSLYEEWWGKYGSQKLSLILKSSIMMRTLLILTSVFLRYFKADWNESKYTLIKKKIKSWLKKEIHNKSPWLRMSFHREKWREEIQMLMYVITLRYSGVHEEDLVNII